LGTDRYAPHILAAGQPRPDHGRRRRGLHVHEAGLFWWSSYLIASGAGVAEVQDRRIPLTAPCLLSIPPGSPFQLELPPACEFSWVEWGVRRAAMEQRVKRGDLHASTARRYRQRSPQPDARETWGVELPLLAPAGLMHNSSLAFLTMATHWWRGPLGLARAEAQLALWLVELVETCQETPQPAWQAHISDPDLLGWLNIAWELPLKSLRVERWAERVGCCRQHLIAAFTNAVAPAPRTGCSGYAWSVCCRS
jgi:hypothetical protein